MSTNKPALVYLNHYRLNPVPGISIKTFTLISAPGPNVQTFTSSSSYTQSLFLNVFPGIMDGAESSSESDAEEDESEEETQKAVIALSVPYVLRITSRETHKTVCLPFMVFICE